jgi:hypothetical protein
MKVKICTILAAAFECVYLTLLKMLVVYNYPQDTQQKVFGLMICYTFSKLCEGYFNILFVSRMVTEINFSCCNRVTLNIGFFIMFYPNMYMLL